MDDRQLVSDQTVNHHSQFETDLQLQKLSLKEGDIVLSHGNLCVLKSIGEKTTARGGIRTRGEGL